jgi:2-dehydropantoate 2-reductase
MKIAIYGAGAIGLWLGAQLARAGAHISVVARGATLQALQRDGMVLHSAGATLRCPVTAAQDPATLGVQDVVIVCVKSPALRDVAQHMAPLLAPQTIVLSAMNGVPWWFLQGFGGAYAGRALQAVDADGSIGQRIPAQHIIGCVLHTSCAQTAPGVVQHLFGKGIILGEPSAVITPRVLALQALFAQAGLDASVSGQIQKDIWYKLWGNMTMNPISAITGATTDKILNDDLVRGFVSSVMLEAKAIGAQIGIPIDQQPEDRHQVTRKLGAFKTSMLQDVEAGKPVELDALVGAVQELGRMVQVPTPCTDALLGLARLHARVRGLY